MPKEIDVSTAEAFDTIRISPQLTLQRSMAGAITLVHATAGPIPLAMIELERLSRAATIAQKLW